MNYSAPITSLDILNPNIEPSELNGKCIVLGVFVIDG
ncbi:hypothetical protein D791_03924 [Nitrincola nitratireducens]|uniref:Uncharacterized protein n=1 Tax=Nitrincola nitratireducens TaxID=1229521 RepID=W9UYZ7_9GAMM|nr:hypothetical protein D791_03924 [Nitrincola nitratireducens]